MSLTLAQIQPVVQSWLADAASTLQIVHLTKSGGAVSVALEGPSAPPPADLLAQAISKRAGQTVTVSVTWRTPAPATAPSAVPASDAQKAQAAVSDWLAAHPGLQALGVSVAGGIATIDLAGTDPAQVTPDLRAALTAQLGPGATIVIRFAQLKTLTP